MIPDSIPKQQRPWWVIPHLMGLDIAVLTLCWAHAFACILGINMYREEPLILLIGSAWLFVMIARLVTSIRGSKMKGANFYSENFPMILVLCLAIGLALLWLLLFAVSAVVYQYLAPFALYLIVSRLPFFSEPMRLLMRSICYAFCCAIPSFYFSVTLAPSEMLTCTPIWYLGVLMFLFFMENRENQAGGASRISPHLVPVGQLLLLLICLYSAWSSSSYEQSVSITIIIANACLALIVRLRHYVSPELVNVLRMPVMMLAPILSVLIFGH